jgi:uncharacterized protein (TIGR02996 family)
LTRVVVCLNPWRGYRDRRRRLSAPARWWGDPSFRHRTRQRRRRPEGRRRLWRARRHIDLLLTDVLRRSRAGAGRRLGGALRGAAAICAVWQVSGTNGENAVLAHGATLAEAYWRACQQAREAGALAVDAEAAFWAQLDATPEAPAVRLVFADWLDDAGRPAAAECLR